MKIFHYISIIPLLFVSYSIYAQYDIDLNKKFGFKDYCFDSHIKTIKLFREGNELSDPIIELGSNDVITVMFDDLNESTRSLYYTIVHCDADWNEDGLFINEYMRGFRENYITRYTYSVNTHTPYTHYSFSIPNNDVGFLTSGNYLLKVYDSSEGGSTPLFQKGFSVFERKVSTKLAYENLYLKGYKKEQQLSFSIFYPSLPVQDPSRDFKVRIEQNGHRIPNSSIPKPTFISSATAEYNRVDENIFLGGNEFRMFDIRILDFPSQGVSLIDRQQNQYQVLLNDAEVRADKPYVTARDLNGRYYIDLDKKLGDKHLESDYVEVYFTLPAKEPYSGKAIYVFGELSGWSLCSSHAMVYNQQRNAYEVTLLLKQGIYNYELVAVDGKGNFDPTLVEGSYSETENTYGVFVYYRSARDRWDRLVSVDYINTRDGVR